MCIVKALAKAEHSRREQLAARLPTLRFSLQIGLRRQGWRTPLFDKILNFFCLITPIFTGPSSLSNLYFSATLSTLSQVLT